MKRIFFSLSGLCGLLLFSPFIFGQTSEAGYIPVSGIYTDLFYNHQLDSLYTHFSTDMKNAMSLPALSDFRKTIADYFGDEKKVLTEKTETISGEMSLYQRICRMAYYPGDVLIQWVTNDHNTIMGFLVKPLTKDEPGDSSAYLTRSFLKLPFDGEWKVVWGGRSVEENYHAAHFHQRYAIDVLQIREGKSHTGDASKNENYFCFDKPVLCPGKGTVFASENGVDDNIPGVMNPSLPMGNYVIIDHGNGEYSYLAHFKKGTVRVVKGDTVTTGQKIGRCGNSGNSSEAHIHYHLQTTPVYGQGDGLPAFFHQYMADSILIEIGEPVRGQSIRN